MGFYTRGKGKGRKVIPIRNTRYISQPDPDPPKKTRVFSHFIDNHDDEADLRFMREKSRVIEESNRKIQELEHEKLKADKLIAEKLKKAREETRRNDEKKKQNELKNKRLGIAVNTTVSAVCLVEPSLAGACLSFKFAKYGYHFIKKFREQYKISGKRDEALLNVVGSEIREKVAILLKNGRVEKAMEEIVDNLYYKFARTGNVSIRPEFEDAIKRSVVESIPSFVTGTEMEKNMPEMVFKKIILRIYYTDIIKKYAQENNIQYPSAELTSVEKKLSELVFHEFDDGKVSHELFLNGEFNGESWLNNNLTNIVELI